MNIRLLLTFAAFIALLGNLTLAQNTPLPDFSAQSRQTNPDQPDRIGSISKSGSFLRLEFTQDGQQIIQIIRPTEGLAYVLFPERQSYLEQRIPPQPEEFIHSYTPPCPPAGEQSGLQCHRLGLEVYQNIPVERWHIGASGGAAQMIILWDPSRKRALRQESSNGIVMQMTFLGMQTVAAREAEHWLTEVSGPGQTPFQNEWWYDSALKLVLRESLADGTQRFIENLVVGPVEPHLFTVPNGWQRLEALPPTAQE